MSIKSIIDQHNASWVELRYCDLDGKERRVSLPADQAGEDLLTDGQAFDGSSIEGWKPIHVSDMVLIPDLSTATLDPFVESPTVFIRCNVIEPADFQPYNRDPRSLALRAEQFLKDTGIGDVVYMGPEPEFFVFDEVRFQTQPDHSFFQLTSDAGHFSSNAEREYGNLAHRPQAKEGYFRVGPVDKFQELRYHICDNLMAMGLTPELHHHEVGGPGQNEIGVKYNSLTSKADEFLTFKYAVMQTADQHGQTATFMPKPITGDNGSGMHVHQSIWKDGKNLFAGDHRTGLSETALHYLGGIIKHGRAINAFTNSTTNSYRRLIPGFEAPICLVWSPRNRSAAIRIPHTADNPAARRIEVRFPDPVSNPYLAFSAMLMAGIDGIKNKYDPGEEVQYDLYELTDQELKERGIPTVAPNLETALDALDSDRDFLTAGGVFDNDMIDAYLNHKQVEINDVRQAVTSMEYKLYYSR